MQEQKNTAENAQAQPSQQAEQNVGAIFRQAREALNLSFEAVAKEIALRPSILQSIENNEFVQKGVPGMFVRGYVRSYAKFLRIPDQVWQHIDFGGAPQNDLGKNARNTRSVNHYSSHNHWVGWVTALVLFVAVAMSGVWWWENHQKDNADREQMVQTFQQNVENNAQTLDNNASKPQVEAVSIAPIQVTTEPQAATANQNVQNVVPTSDEKTLQKTTALNEVAPMQVEQIDNGNAVEMPTISETSPLAASGELVIEVTGNCWISVKNKNRKTLAEKEYKAGEVLTFNEGEPYSLIIGAPSNVKISYKGEAYPLTVDGRVARFKLPQ